MVVGKNLGGFKGGKKRDPKNVFIIRELDGDNIKFQKMGQDPSTRLKSFSSSKLLDITFPLVFVIEEFESVQQLNTIANTIANIVEENPKYMPYLEGLKLRLLQEKESRSAN